MTQRERHTSAAEGHGLAAAAPPLAATQAALPRSGPAVVLGTHRPPLWEDLYRSASPAQQQELLSLAGRQGLLYAHQLPPAGNGSRSANSDEEAGARPLLPRLLSGQGNDLEPVRVHPVAVNDPALDPAQREAVARALNTPDLCLIQGLPGTGKSRVAAEIITQAAAQGLRILLLAPSAAAVDRVLLLAGTHDAVCPLRCLGRDETIDTLAPAVRALTFSERVRSLSEQSLQRAQSALEKDEQRYRRCQQDAAVWGRLDELAEQHRHLHEQVGGLSQRRSGCVDEIERETQDLEGEPQNPLRSALRALHSTHQQTLARLDTEEAEARRQIAERRQELTAREPELTSLRPLAEAKQQGRWWTPAWWRATLQGKPGTRLETLEAAQHETQQAIAGLEETLGRLGQERVEAERAFQAERVRLVEAEVARRRAELDDQETALGHEQKLLEDKWQRASQELDSESQRPADLTRPAVQAAHTAWQQRLEHEEQRLAFTREWASYLQESAGTLSARLPEYVNLVAATTTGLAADAHFGDQAASGRLFDLLVLEEADQVTESDFLKVARRARRWVLIGQAISEEPAVWSAERGSKPAGARSALLDPRSSIFQRLWERLHCDPRRLPYSWVRENDRLCCRLRPLNLEQRQWLESERVADFPEIELRILVWPRLEPMLAEVVFPPSLSMQQAKEYIYKELQELPVEATGHSLRWVEEPERVVLHVGEVPAAGTCVVTLELGVREVGGVKNAEPPDSSPSPAAPDTERPAGWTTGRVEFDRSAGWQRERAEDWVRRYLGVCDLGRTACLDVPHRMRLPLAAVLADLLYEGSAGYRLPSPECGRPALAGAAFELVAVPPLASETSSRRHGAAEGRARGNGTRVTAPPVPRTNRGGAGLELDLTAARHADRLPTELRAGLPNRGFVNYLEAQAVVRRLEALLTNPEVRALAGQAGSGQPAVAVIALYPAQVELIRRLIGQTPALATCGPVVEVGVPAAFRQREAPVVFLSLTRSHSHRAVSLGEGPQDLVLALTRARDRLIVFGDLGTLARRSEWEGPLDHLDETAAGQERRLVIRLLRLLPGPGRPAEGGRRGEGSGA